ncbi:hypothetical protein HMPREF3197_02430 [Klebsiella pneumoniae]|nr:hypothetical protein HMPREF3197_02430 [Klebsiella pneumoniae]
MQRWTYGAKTAYVHQLATILASPSIQIFPMRRPPPFPENFLAVSRRLPGWLSARS